MKRKLLIKLEAVVLLLTLSSICAGGLVYLWEIPEREQDRLVRELTLRQNAWVLLDQAKGHDTNIGQVLALTTLNELGDSLERLDLPNTSVENADLREVSMSFADLEGASISYSNFSGGTLFGANMNKVMGSGAVFNGTQMIRAQFCSAKLQNANFSSAKVLEVDFRGADLSRTDFSFANVGGADFTGAYLNGADFTHAINLTQEQVASACIGKHRMVWVGRVARPNSEAPKLPEGFSIPPVCQDIDFLPLEHREVRPPHILCDN